MIISLALCLCLSELFSLILQSGQTSNQTSRTVRNAAYGYTNDSEQVNSVTVPVNSAYTEINDGMVYYSNEF